MQCSECGAANPAKARFCMHCGVSLVARFVCAQCFTDLPTSANYCFHCGARVQRVNRPSGADQLAAAPRVDAPVPIEDLLPALRGYLSNLLYEPLERVPTERDLLNARDHLEHVLETAKTYLPRPVKKNPQPPGVPTGGMAQGTFLFVDVTGFTPLGERLSKLGQAGAERMTAIMNDLFHELVSILKEQRGTLLKFGGDALLALFDDDNMQVSALRAVQTAFAMQAMMKQFEAVEAAGETSPLLIKCGLSSGEYFSAHVGTKRNMIYMTSGLTVNDAELAEDAAASGEIIAAISTYDLVSDYVNAVERKEGFLHLTSLSTLPPLEAHPESVLDTDLPTEPSAAIAYLVQRLDRLTPYLADHLVPRMVQNPHDIEIVPDHRPVTVIFVNYAGLGELIAEIGRTQPELIVRQLQNYMVQMVHIVERYGGSLARMDQYAVGDRLVIFFGAPKAHEDDPVRAVHTALDMQDAMQQAFASLKTSDGHEYSFRQRIGINTGYLFAGNIGATDLRQEYTLMGDDINMAARLMSNAKWDDILISGQTQAPTEAAFNTENIGTIQVKGKEKLVPAYRVLERRPQVLEQIGAVRGSETPLIGRAEPIQTLLKSAERVINGRGQVVCVIAESGLGKTRLAREFKHALDVPVTWLDAQGLSFSEHVSYWLIAQLIYDVLGLTEEADSATKYQLLQERGITLLGSNLAQEALPFIANLLDLDGESVGGVKALPPRARQKQTFWAVRQFFQATGERKPTIIAIDDLHWSDEASVIMLEDLLAISDYTPVMFLFLFRPMRDSHAWTLRESIESQYPHRYVEVQLSPLPESEGKQLLAAHLPGAEFSPNDMQNLLAKVAGNPLYIEEVARVLIDEGAVAPDQADPGRWIVMQELTNIHVPDSLHGAIIARMDRLTEDVRQALQMASVIGRRFQLQLIRNVAGAESELDSWLAELERYDMIRALERSFYNFADTLVQEVAYDSLLLQRRREFHKRIGETLEATFKDDLAANSETLAYHFSRSSDRDKALHYLMLAGASARDRFANETALRYYQQVLAIIDERDSAEAHWQTIFEVLKQRQRIYSVMGKQAEREADLQEMLHLLDGRSDTLRRADTLNEMADFYQWTGKYDQALGVGRESLTLAREVGSQLEQADALHQIGVVEYYRGDYTASAPALQEAAELRQALDDPAGESWSELYLTMISFKEGNYSEALAHNIKALEAAKERQDWMLMGIHLNNAGRIYHRLGEYGTALRHFMRSLELRSRVGDRTGEGFTLYGIGLVQAYLGNYGDAQTAFQQSLDIRQAIDDERGQSYSIYGLGLAAKGLGQFAEAQSFLEKAEVIQAKLGLKGERATTLSVLAEVLLESGRIERALSVSAEAAALVDEGAQAEEAQGIYLTHYRILNRLGRPEALPFLEKAHAALQAQADAITDQQKRKIFLSNVRINRQLETLQS